MKRVPACLSALAFASMIGAYAGPAQAQVLPRTIDQQLTDIDLLFNILTATVDGINIDDPVVMSALFPDYAFADFDRDRDGEFMTFPAALGLFDLQLAITQFNHDPVDADGDGVLGFYELECQYAGRGIQLDPALSETTPGQPDGDVDCDGDGVSNIIELTNGTNPLDANDYPPSDFEVVDTSVGNPPFVATSDDGQYELFMEPARQAVFQGDDYRLELNVVR